VESDTHRPEPISADLLAQAVSIERCVCFGRDGTDERIKVDGGAATAEWMIVTWRGPAWAAREDEVEYKSTIYNPASF
jgi:hypothetical protein